KSYVYVTDIVAAVLTAYEKVEQPFQVFNVATGDYITVNEIADLAVACVGLRPGSVAFELTGGDRGWKGDVPVVRLSTKRINALGWTCQHSSKEALRKSMLAMIAGLNEGRG